jgi:hypothetical protein
MEVKILEKCYVGTGGNLHKGTVVELDDRVAEKLIARGYAEKNTQKKTKKLSNKAIKELKTPEGE